MKGFRKFVYLILPLAILITFLGGCGDSATQFKKERSLLYYKVRNVTGLTTNEMVFKSTKRKDYPLFIVEDGELYLLRQVTWAGFLGTKGKPNDWSDTKLRDLIKKNDLHEYFPDIGSYYAGVEWLIADENKRKKSDSD